MKAAIYARVSTDEQNLSSQLQDCREWCSRMNFQPVEYLDKTSGSSISREALDRLMKDVRRGKVKTVVAYKLDRLGRSLVHLAQMVGEFDTYGVALVCPSQGIDTRATNPAGRLQMHVLMAVAEFERSLIRERTKAGLASARVRGATLGRPTGSRLNLPVNECRAAVAAGMSLRAFARDKGLSESSMRRAMASRSGSGRVA
jgi:DNA invertase Pin-like site-specific DNA recombinase